MTFPSRFKRARALRAFIAFFLWFYFSGGLLTVFYPPKYEVFPVFSWFLFGLTPNPQMRYAIRISSWNGRDLSQPVYYEEGNELHIQSHDAIFLHSIAQNLGKALEGGNSDDVTQFRAIMENNYLSPPCDYELVEIVYDPIKRWKTGHKSESIIKRFQSKSENQ